MRKLRLTHWLWISLSKADALAIEGVAYGPSVPTSYLEMLNVGFTSYLLVLILIQWVPTEAYEFKAFLLPFLTHCLFNKMRFLQSHFLYWKYFSRDPVRHQRQCFHHWQRGGLIALGGGRFGRTSEFRGSCMCWHRQFLAFLGYTWELTGFSSRSKLDHRAQLVFLEPVWTEGLFDIFCKGL